MLLYVSLIYSEGAFSFYMLISSTSMNRRNLISDGHWRLSWPPLIIEQCQVPFIRAACTPQRCQRYYSHLPLGDSPVCERVFELQVLDISCQIGYIQSRHLKSVFI